MKALELKRSKLTDIEAKYALLLTRSEAAQTSLSEAKTDEDLALVEAEITSIETEQATIDEERKTVEQEITQLELDLQEVENRSKETNVKTKKTNAGAEKRMNKLQVRELLRTGEYYNRPEVIEFFEKFKNLRAVTGSDLTIPDVVINRIMDLLGDFSTLYPIVDKVRVSGTARVLIDTDDTPAVWTEMGAPLTVADTGTITSIIFDGYKVGKVTFLDNHILQDSLVNLEEYVSRKIAKAIGRALDVAILSGTGDAGKQPTGILPSLPAENRVTVAADATLAEIVAPLSLVDTGEDSVGQISAVMRRSTYYARFLAFSINVDGNGNTVGKLPNLNQPDLLGLPIVFNNTMAPDTVLYGEFEKYTLVERENITVDSSEMPRYIEDQHTFRGKGRFDGRPTKPEAFCLVTIGTPTV